MAQTIKLKRSGTQNAVPSTSQLALGEVAINTYDGKMYIKKNDGSDSIVEIGGDVTSSSGLDLTGNLNLADNVRIVIGDGNDLQVYHDGSTSWIQDSAADLRVETNGLTLRSISQENYITAAVNGAVTVYYDGSAKLATTNDGVTVTGDVEADEFIGDIRGAVLFKAQAGETLAKGEVVYISGISGNTTIVSKADADDASKMPAFGLAAAAASSGNPVDVYTNGILSGIDTSSYSEGDELFVSTTAGALTATAPTGESAALQKIGKVTRSASSGSIFIVGAGRSNAVPNLDDGDIFIGNSSNQAVTQSLTTASQNAGALMDSEVTNLAQVKAFDSSDYATAAQGSTADSAMQDLVDDTSPQLGGNLDLNSNNITGTGNISNTGTISSGAITTSGTLDFTANPAYIRNDQDNSGQIIISTKNSSGSAQQVRWDAANASSGAWRPEVTNVSNLGLTNRIWNTLYVNNIRMGSGNNQFVDASRNITAGTISSGNITTTGYLRGPSTFTIDPAAHGDNTGTVVIAGNLQVDGTTTTINSTTLTVDDKNITLASGSINKGAANGAGLTVDCGSDTDATFIYDGTNDAWSFNKDVGIGTSAPGAKLHILQTAETFNDGIKLVGSSGPISGRIYMNGEHLHIDNATAGANTGLTLDDNGNVGINNGNPNFSLDISGADNSQLRLLGIDTNPTTLVMDYNSGGATGRVRIQNDDGDLKFTTNNGNVRQTILENGNVGIGTTSPSAPLSLLDASLTTQGTGEGGLRVHRPNAASQYGYFDYGYNEGGVNIGSLYTGGGASAFGTFTFRQHSSGSSQIPMFIGNTGNVGIGTSSPSVPLHVDGSGRFDLSSGENLYLYRSSASNLTISLGSANTDFSSAGTINFKPEGTTIQKYQFKSADFIVNGPNVGIGTTSPQAALHIYDTPAEILRMEGNDEFAYASFYGTVSSTAQRLGYMGFANDTSTAADFNFANNQGGIFSFNAGIETVGTVHNNSTQVGFKHTAHGVATGNTNKHSFQIGRWQGNYNKWMLVPETEGTPTYQREFGFSFVENGWFAEGPFHFTSYVGIGTANPATNLDIAGTLAAPPTIRLSNTTTGFTQGDNVGQIEFYHADPTDFTPGAFGIIRGVAGPSGGEGSIQVLTNMPSEGSDANDVTIEFTGAGAVKISDAFTLPTSDGQGNQVLQTDGSGNVSWASISGVGTATEIADADGDTKIQVEESSDEDKIRFDVAGSQLMQISPNGVGINEQNIDALLHLSHGSLPNIKLERPGTKKYAIGITGTDFRIDGTSDNLSTPTFTITSPGNVGIGTSSPGYKLDISGTTNFGDTTYYNGGTAGIISWNNNVKLKVRAASNHALSLGAGGTEDYLYINTSGNVGIGATSLSSGDKLTVNGNIKLNGKLFNGASNNSVGLDFANNYVNYYGYAGHRFYAQAAAIGSMAERMRITVDGNVGIGTTSPAGRLDVQQNTTGQLLARVWNTNTSGTGESVLRIANSGNNAQGSRLEFTDQQYYHSSISTDRTNGIQFGVNATGNTGIATERMRIDSSGRVGIGTTAPIAPLHVAGNAVIETGSPDLYFATTSASHTNWRVAAQEAVNQSFEIASGTTSAGSNAVNDTYTTRFVINSSGNVGIGTTSPGHKLHVSESAAVTRVVIDNTANATAGSGIYLRTFNSGSMVSNATIRTGNNGDFSIWTGTTGEGQRLTIDSTGNVGIGLTDPDQKLDVNGNIRIPNAGKIVFGSAGASPGDYLELNDVGSSGDLLKLVQDSTTRLAIQGVTGNVSIGVTTPFTVGGTAKLSLSTENNTYLTAGASTSDLIYSRRYSSGHYQTQTYLSNNTGSLELQPYGGNVGIGTSATVSSTLQVEVLGIDTTTTSTTATTQVAIDTMAAATFRSAEFTIQVTNSTDSTYHLTKVLLIHDGTTPGITEYGTVFTGSAAEATFDADISSGNVRLLATPASTDSMTFKVVRHCITV